MAIYAKVMRYLQQTRTPPSVFGRRSINDPRLVDDLRNGREPRERTQARIEAYISAHPDEYRPPARPTRRRCSNAP